MGGKSSKQETKQTNEPPAWAKPALQRAGQDALKLYESGSGYNTYTGPTQAPLSDVTLGGMNNMLAATGFTGAPVSNESINKNIPDVQAIMQQMMANKPQQQAPAQSQSLWGQSQEGPNEAMQRRIYERQHGEGTWAQHKATQQDKQYAFKSRSSGR